MSKRIEVLNNLKAYVESGENVEGHYVVIHDEKPCYCAIGYIASQYGVSDKELGRQNSVRIDAHETQHIHDAIQQDFTLKELVSLQEFNDMYDNDGLLEEIDNLIEKTSFIGGKNE